MSYIQGLGAADTATHVWVATSPTTGYYRRRRAGETGTVTATVRTHSAGEEAPERKVAPVVKKDAIVRERRAVKVAEQCIAAGVPPELVELCVRGRKTGVPLEKVISELQKLTPEELAELGVGVPVAPPPKKKGKLLLYGGGVAAVLVLFLLLRRKKS